MLGPCFLAFALLYFLVFALAPALLLGRWTLSISFFFSPSPDAQPQCQSPAPSLIGPGFCHFGPAFCYFGPGFCQFCAWILSLGAWILSLWAWILSLWAWNFVTLGLDFVTFGLEVGGGGGRWQAYPRSKPQATPTLPNRTVRPMLICLCSIYLGL